MNTRKFPQLDHNQARRQLELLGYRSNDKVFVRFFYPSSDPRKHSDKGRKEDFLNPQQIEAYQRAGRGVYFVINGGGHKNKDVEFGRAIFIEHDHLAKEVQQQLWKELELPQPTFQIDTGGKSIHSYWVFTKAININQWQELQLDLLEYTDGDRSIKNPARVMRLAGAWHISINEKGEQVYNQSRIISDSGQKYSYEELREMIPSEWRMESEPIQNSKFKIQNKLFPIQNQEDSLVTDNWSLVTEKVPNPQSPIFYRKSIDQIQIPVPEPIPLLECCRKEVRQWVVSGIPQGQRRNDTAINVGLELVAVERHLQNIGQTFTDTARQLFSEYCQKSGMSEQEDEERWQWCATKNPTPSCTAEGVETCVRSWYLKNESIQNQEQINSNSIQNPKLRSIASEARQPKIQNLNVTSDTRVNGDSSNSDMMGITDTVTTVTAILQQGLTDYQEQAQLDALEANSVMSKNAFAQLVKSIQCQLDEVQPEDKNRFEQLWEWHNVQMEMERIFPPDLAYALIHDAEILNIDPVMLVQYLLPSCFSLVGKRATLNVESHSVPAILWNCIVAESGTGKSRAENVILDPLKKWQIEERRRFEQEYEEYEKQKKNLAKEAEEPPLPNSERKYLFQVATIQAVMKRLAEQKENGTIWSRDELAGLLKSLGQFSKRGSENEALECFLELWDGKAAFIERMDEIKNSYVASSTCLSIAGGIQPKAFRQAFKDPDDPQGLQARFLYAVPQELPMKRVRGYCVLSDLLPMLYQRIQQCPQGEIKLSPEASALYSEFVAKIGQQTKKSPNAAIRAWMRKLPSHLLRLAFCLHVIEWAYAGEQDFFTLGVDTLNRAAELATYYQNAFQVIQEKASDSDAVSSMLIKIYDLALTKPEGISPRDAYRHVKAIARRAKELGRKAGAYTIELLTQLAQMGKGILHQEGRFFRFIANLKCEQKVGLVKNAEEQGSTNVEKQEQYISVKVAEEQESRRAGETIEENFSSAPRHLGTSAFQHRSTKIASPESVTEVTKATTKAKQEFEASPFNSVSPVTDELRMENEDFWHSEEEIQNESIQNSPSKIQNVSPESESSLIKEPKSNSNQFFIQRQIKENAEQESQNPEQMNSKDLPLSLWEVVPSVNSQSSLNSNSIPNPQSPIPNREVQNPEDLLVTDNCSLITEKLMACQTLAELKAFKNQHGEMVNNAYRNLTAQQQLHVDSISATAVPYPVYKYTGSVIEVNGKSLKQGMLVYIDPKVENQNSTFVPVWLMRGLELGWQQAVSVSKDCLHLIEKAITDDDWRTGLT